MRSKTLIASYCSSDAVRMIASHDLLLMELRELLQTRTGPKLDVQIAGSLGGITALGKSRCDIAGFHFPEGDIGQNVLREFQPLLRPRTQILIHFVRRTQGFIVARGNPLNIHGIADIIKTKARFINRQRGSGTQITFDLMLERDGIDKRKIMDTTTRNTPTQPSHQRSRAVSPMSGCGSKPSHGG